MVDTQDSFPLDELTGREMEILRLIEVGCTNREIAQRLVLSLETIKWYNKQIFSKLGVHNRTEAVAIARAAGHLGMDRPSGRIPLEGELPDDIPQHNLPAQVTSFIGRQREIADILSLLETTRLLTLSGPPGTGKTRLALQVASKLRRQDQFEDGVYFVELAPINDPQFVPITIAQVFEIGETGSSSLVNNLKNFLHNKKLLLVLDNYEQIIETAPLVSELLSTAPGLKVMVTSRQVLQIYGEQEYLVPPLKVPDTRVIGDLKTLSRCEAVTLFCQRAQAVKPDFHLTEENASAIAEISVRLDGLPLTIELAAARIKLLTPKMILSRLGSRLDTLTGGARNLPSRMQTLRGTIDWSFDLLDDDEKVLFRRLSIFQGGRTLESAEVVCAPGLSTSVMEGLESLLNKSLLYQEDGPGGEPRFLMLETIHEYAREKLVESKEADKLRQMHAEYFARLAERAEKKFTGPEQAFWFERLGSEHDNLRTALAYALGSNQSELGLRIASALRDFWFYMGHVGEGLGWIERALRSAEDASPALRAKALNASGWLAFIQGDYENGKHFNQSALSIYRELGDDINSAWALVFLCSHCSGSRNEITEGFALGEEALSLFRSLDEKAGIIRALNSLGELARLDGDYDRARVAYEECFHLCRETGDRLREAFAVGNLGLVAQRQGHYQQAEDYMMKALRLLIDLKTKYVLSLALTILSGPVASRGDPGRAAQLLGASDAILGAMGLDLQPADGAEIDRYKAGIHKQLGDSGFQSAWRKGQSMTLEQAIAFALGDDPENGL